jgi:integrase
MSWDELDLQAATWTIPAERSKNGEAHVVPLSPLALDELNGLEEQRGGLIFTVTGKTSPSGWSKAKRRLQDEMQRRSEAAGLRAVEPWKTHDLRRTLATGLQGLGIRFEVTEAVLNHLSGSRSGVAGVYQRFQWKEEKREALDRWSAKIAALVGSPDVPADGAGNVVHMSNFGRGR